MEAQRDDERCTIRNQYSCLFDRRQEDLREANSLKSKHGRLEDINKKKQSSKIWEGGRGGNPNCRISIGVPFLDVAYTEIRNGRSKTE